MDRHSDLSRGKSTYSTAPSGASASSHDAGHCGMSHGRTNDGMGESSSLGGRLFGVYTPLFDHLCQRFDWIGCDDNVINIIEIIKAVHKSMDKNALISLAGGSPTILPFGFCDLWALGEPSISQKSVSTDLRPPDTLEHVETINGASQNCE
jgi:hypothetical protein